MASETGQRRKETFRRKHNAKAAAVTDGLEQPITLKQLAYEAGLGYNPTRLMSLEAVQEAREKGLISPSSRGRLPNWAKADEDRISPNEVKADIVAEIMNEHEVDSFPEEERETLTAFIVGEVDIAYGSSAMKRLRQRIREQVSTMQHTAGAVVEQKAHILQLNGKVDQLQISFERLDRRMNDRMDQMFRYLPPPSHANGGGRRRSASETPPPAPEEGDETHIAEH